MNAWHNIQLALRAISGNLLRTVLTFLIIAFGIMALVGILTAIDSMKASIVSNFSKIGANSFTIRSRKPEKEKHFDIVGYKDAVAFKDRFIHDVIISISTNAAKNATVKFRNRKTNPTITVMGVDENYIGLSGHEFSYGRNMSINEVQTGANVAILGSDVKDRLFTKSDTIIGASISVGNLRYQVIGALESKGSSIMSNDNMVFIPELNARRFFSTSEGKYVISVEVDHPSKLDGMVDEATAVFRGVRKIRPTDENDFEISRSDKLATTVISNLSTISMAATIIGLITLLGAGIGLMNIMLVSVSERTREIGISKAIGAKRRNIIVQFLMESVVICQIGGLLGIFFGVIIGNAVSFALRVGFIMPWGWIFAGFAFCLFIGLAAGLYPAIKASKLDPIEALRYE